MNCTIRLAKVKDCTEILRIYAPYITGTNITFETEIPTPDAFRKRMKAIMAQYPYLVCEYEAKIIGYAYASKHHERAAYGYSVNVSVYISPEYQGKGLGKRLYRALFELLQEQGYYTALAGITVPNEKSLRLHEAMGFMPVGTYHNVGYKDGQWLDVIWLEKSLRAYGGTPAAVKSIHDLPAALIKTALA